MKTKMQGRFWGGVGRGGDLPLTRGQEVGKEHGVILCKQEKKRGER